MIVSFEGKDPQVAAGVFIAESALVMGEVTLGADTSIWYGCIVRGDVNYIHIGSRTNIQDRSVIHVTAGQYPTTVGDNVTVGHGAILHGCSVGNDALVGMGAVLLDGTEIRPGSIVAAGALVPPNKTFPEGSLIMGNPARVVRRVSAAEHDWIRSSAEHYVDLARRHR